MPWNLLQPKAHSHGLRRLRHSQVGSGLDHGLDLQAPCPPSQRLVETTCTLLTWLLTD